MGTSFTTKLHTLFILIVLLSGGSTYVQSLSYPFQFDDKANITENPILTSLNNFVDLEAAQGYQAKPGYPAMVRRYVGYLTFALDYAVHGFDVEGYRIVNLAIHLVNAVFVYLLVLVLFRTPVLCNSPLASKAPLGALLAGVLFVTHPIQTQAVTFVVQRLASLATLFYLLAFVSYLKARLSLDDKWSRGWFILSLVSAVLGMKTKEIVFTLPLAVVMAELYFFEGDWRARLRWLIPLGLTMLIIPLTELALHGGEVGEAASISEVDMPRLVYLFTEIRVLVTYLRLWLLPVNQSVIYDYPVYESLFSIPVILSGMVLAGLFGFGIYLFNRANKGEATLKVMAFGIFWFFLTLMVESSLVPLYPIFEHRMYLPSVGLSLAMAIGVMFMIHSGRQRKAAIIRVMPIVFIPIIMTCLAFSRDTTWKDELVLWRDTVIKAPGSLTAALNLAGAYKARKDHANAIALYRKTLTMKPFKYRVSEDNYHYSIALDLIGDMYHELNDIQRATRYYEDAIKANTSKLYVAYALNNLGSIWQAAGNADRAVEYYKQAVSTYPYYLDCYNLGSLLIRLQRYDEAAYYLSQAIELDATKEDAYYNLGAAYFMTRNYEKAIHAYQKSLSLNPRRARASVNIARIYLELDNTEKAVLYLNKALAINPRDPEANRILGILEP